MRGANPRHDTHSGFSVVTSTTRLSVQSRYSVLKVNPNVNFTAKGQADEQMHILY